MAKLQIHSFDAATAFTLLYTALLSLGHRIHSCDLASGIVQIFLHDKMKLVIHFPNELPPFLQICSMNDTIIIELRFKDYDIVIKRSERRKTGSWLVPEDKSVLDAEILMVHIRATINQYIHDHYDVCVLETSHDIDNLSHS